MRSAWMTIFACIGLIPAVRAQSGGDWPMMNLDERKAVIEAVADVNAGRLPIIAGAQSFDIRDSAALARFCA